MKTPDTISKGAPPLGSMDYAALLERGVSLCQQLGGEIWTDYNEHDPGVTILEQLCYAVSELGLRLDLPMADLLAVGAHGELLPDLLTPGHQALTGAPLTVRDYRKLLYDQITNLKNAWLVPADSGVAGLYRVLVETHGNEGEDKDSEHYRSTLQTLQTAVQKVLRENRNLGEDFSEIVILAPWPINVAAEVEIEEQASATQVLATIMFELQNYLVPFPQARFTEQLPGQERPYEELYEGPLLDLGTIDDDTLADLPTCITVEKVARIISKVAGVRAVEGLTVCGQTQGPVKIETDTVPRLEPSIFKPLGPDQEYPIHIQRNGAQVQVSPERVFHLVSDMEADIRQRETLAAERSAADPYRYLQPGVKQELDAYYSIQRHFPAVYGVGPIGAVPPLRQDAERTAQIAQLKAYLLFFEQLLADYAQQIAHARELFSLQPSLKSSYFFRPLVRSDNVGMEPPDLLRYRIFSQEPPAPARGRYVVYLLDPERSGAIQLRSREAGTEAEAQLLRESMLLFGAERSNYALMGLPNGEWHLTLNGDDGALAFGGERFHDLALLQREADQLARRLALLAEQGPQRGLELRIERRDRLVLRLCGEDGRTLLSAEHQNAAQQEYCRQLLLKHGADLRHYRVQHAGTGELRLQLLDPGGRQLMHGEERFATVGEAHQGAERLAQLVAQVARDSALRSRLLVSIPPAEAAREDAGLREYERRLEMLEHKLDRPVERRNRFLNHLLARVGESFDDGVLDKLDPRPFGERDAFYQELVDWKLAFLTASGALIGQRSVGRDGSKEGSRSRLEERLFCLLGVQGSPQESLYDGETMILIEHVLLRPAAAPPQSMQDDFFAPRLSVYFPSAPQRFSNPDFRRFAARTLAENCPAHLAAECHWLESDEMDNLTRLYAAWSQQLRAVASGGPWPGPAAQQLRDFIECRRVKA